LLPARPLDLATSAHYEPDITNFIRLAPCKPFPIEIADGYTEDAIYRWDIQFQCQSAGELCTIDLKDIYYTPWMSTPLISLGQLRPKGYIFSNEVLGTLTDPSKKVILKVPVKHRHL